MIVVVEGPSAAGKTTWARRSGPEFVVEEHPRLSPPADATVADAVQFWVEADARRWTAALAAEATHGYAVCDTDPLKLHYRYCCARVGAESWDSFRIGVAKYRRAIAGQQLGIADVILCNVPDADILRQRKDADVSRARRNFDRHRQLAEPLRDWYTALDRIDPGRVAWGYPDDLPPVATRDRYDIDLFDKWMAALEATIHDARPYWP